MTDHIARMIAGAQRNAEATRHYEDGYRAGGRDRQEAILARIEFIENRSDPDDVVRSALNALRHDIARVMAARFDGPPS